MACVERGERLVEQQQARAHQQRAGDGDPLALAAREQARSPIQQMADIEQGDDARKFIVKARAAAHPAAVVDVLPNVKMREQPTFLKHIADMTTVRWQVDAGGGVEQHGLIESDSAAIRLDQAGDDVDEGCLSRTRWSE